MWGIFTGKRDDYWAWCTDACCAYHVPPVLRTWRYLSIDSSLDQKSKNNNENHPIIAAMVGSSASVSFLVTAIAIVKRSPAAARLVRSPALMASAQKNSKNIARNPRTTNPNPIPIIAIALPKPSRLSGPASSFHRPYVYAKYNQNAILTNAYNFSINEACL